MQKSICLLLGLVIILTASAQKVPLTYTQNIQKADSNFVAKNYVLAINFYNQAFNGNNGLGKVRDRYKTAICWVKLSNYDSAFSQLNRIAEKGKFSDVDLLLDDVDFAPLHKDTRWVLFIDQIRQNRKSKEE